MALLDQSLSRRRMLAGLGGAAAALAMPPLAAMAAGSRGHALAGPAAGTPAPASVTLPGRHLAWVWMFSADGSPEHIRRVAAEQGLGIALKTHDGVEWMSKYDRASGAVSGPTRLAELVRYFEAWGVPVHAWAVVHGADPAREARMAADVLAAGARSISLDLESYSGFWRGTAAGAREYGERLRAEQPSATVMTSIDARPWEYDRIPLQEFAAFSNAIAPQVYWTDFATPPNVTRYKMSGEYPLNNIVTASFALDVAARRLSFLRLPIHPIGPGLGDDTAGWRQFMDTSTAQDAQTFSVWRFGTLGPRVLRLLKDNPPKQQSYVVQPGDTIWDLAAAWGTTIGEIASRNGIVNPSVLPVGRVLQLPHGARLPR